MPPPLPVESETESAADDKKNEEADATMKEEGDDVEEEDGEEDEDGETYIVEAIQDHRQDFEDGLLRYHVKWKGYEKKSDRTWETEENLEGAREILDAYWKSLGGKPTPGSKAGAAAGSGKKRGRQSQGGKTPDTTKRPKMSKRASKSNGAMEQDVDHSPAIGYTDAGDDDWKPPAPKDGAWDPLVQSVDTVVRENSDGELWGYLIWNDKNDDGRFYRSKAKLPTIYRACPQRMLHFYEKHLVFSTANEQDAPEAATDSRAADANLG